MRLNCRFMVVAGTLVALLAMSFPAGSAAPTPTAALATDQACTRQADSGATLQSTAYRPDDLAAMTLRKGAFGSAARGYETEWAGYGYTDNTELWKMMLAPRHACAMNRAHGRIVGFARSYWGTQTVDSAVHLFFTSAGAANWLSAYVDGMKALVGHEGVTSVQVTRVRSLGPGAVRVTDQCSDNCVTTRVFFLRGPVIGAVRDSHFTGTRPVIDVVAVAKKLSARMAARSAVVESRGQDQYDAAVMLSAGLPKELLGTRYAGLVWDWYYGGCWDAAEAAQQTTYIADRRQYQADAAKFGMLSFCRAMYVPPGTRAAVNGVMRAFNGGFLYRSATGAHGALDALVTEWRQRAGKTVGGTKYGRLVRFDPGNVGADAVGLQQRYGNPTGDVTVTRVYFRLGRYLAVDALVSRDGSGAQSAVRRWARLLDRRVTLLGSTRTF